MRATTWLLLALAGVLAACDTGPGTKDGYCDFEDVNGIAVTHVPGDYRCAGTKVEVCTYGEDPLRDRPEWQVLSDCMQSVDLATNRYGTCVMEAATGKAVCVYTLNVE